MAEQGRFLWAGKITHCVIALADFMARVAANRKSSEMKGGKENGRVVK